MCVMAAINAGRPFVLGSGSAGRRMMLQQAGLAFEVIHPQVDEEALKDAFLRTHGPEELPALADALAAAKAREVSTRTDRLVVGGDQILVLNGELFSKPRDMAEARANLRRLRGKTHHLISALAIARNGRLLWQYRDAAAMTMRAFSDAFLDLYLQTAGAKALSSVGCYQLEGLGIHLFENIEGDCHTIIGLPLLALLARLRALGVVPA